MVDTITEKKSDVRHTNSYSGGPGQRAHACSLNKSFLPAYSFLCGEGIITANNKGLIRLRSESNL